MKVLIVQTSFLGDVVLSTPVVTGVRALYPDAELWMMTTPLAAPLVCSDPFLTGVMTYDKRGEARGLGGILRTARAIRAKKFDVVYSLHRSARTSLVLALAGIPKRVGFAEARGAFLYHQLVERRVGQEQQHDVMRNLQILSKEEGKIDYPKSLRLTVPDVSALSPVVQEFLTPKRPYVVLVPGSVWKTKRWFSDGYREVAEHFLNTGMRVLVLGSPQEIEVCGEVSKNLSVDDLSGKTSLQEVVRLIHDAELAVCNDSFAQHVASAVQTRNVVVFCATSPEFGFGPWQNAATVVEKSGLSCKPCRRHGSQQCPTGTESCMKDLPSVQVIEAAQQLLEHSSTSGGRSGFKGH